MFLVMGDSRQMSLKSQSRMRREFCGRFFAFSPSGVVTYVEVKKRKKRSGVTKIIKASDDALGKHCIRHLNKPCDIGSGNKVTVAAKFVGGTEGGLIDIFHYRLKLCINLLG